MIALRIANALLRLQLWWLRRSINSKLKGM